MKVTVYITAQKATEYFTNGTFWLQQELNTLSSFKAIYQASTI